MDKLNENLLKIKKYAHHFNVNIFHDTIDFTPLLEYLKLTFSDVTLYPLSSLQNPVPKPLSIIISDRTDALLDTLHPLALANIIILSTQANHPKIYQFGMKLNAMYVDTLPNDEKGFLALMRNVIPLLRKRYIAQLTHAQYHKLIEQSGAMFAVFENQQPAYMNDTIKSLLGAKIEGDSSKYTLQQLILSTDPKKALSKTIRINGHDFHLHCITNPKGHILANALPIHMPANQVHNTFINRIQLSEYLKTTILNDTKCIPIAIYTIKNNEKISTQCGSIIYNEIVKTLLDIITERFNKQITIAQWSENTFILLPEIADIYEIKPWIEEIHHSASQIVTLNDVKPIAQTFVVEMRGLDLQKSLDLIENIASRHLSSNTLHDLSHYEVVDTANNLDSQKQILHQLEKMMLAKSDISLLNFYKGMNITTKGKILKVDGGKVYITKQKIQGYAMKVEGNVIIQAVSLSKDLLGTVKLVDIDRKLAILSDFIPLQISANQRKHTRVQSDHRIHITLSNGKKTFSSTILDLSIESFACTIKNGNNDLKLEKGDTIKASFNLPSKRTDTGFAKIDIDTTVGLLLKNDDTTKIILFMNLYEPYETYLSEYIYQRQHELVNEIKAIALKFK